MFNFSIFLFPVFIERFTSSAASRWHPIWDSNLRYGLFLGSGCTFRCYPRSLTDQSRLCGRNKARSNLQGLVSIYYFSTYWLLVLEYHLFLNQKWNSRYKNRYFFEFNYKFCSMSRQTPISLVPSLVLFTHCSAS